MTELSSPEPSRAEQFAQRAGERRSGALHELWDFLRTNKRWWLTPIVIVLVLLGALIVFSQGSAVAPFIYTLF